jgi:hypothetical protein
LFLSNNDSSAKIEPNGVVTAAQRGEAFVMARFATFTVGAQVIVIPKELKYEWPQVEEKNFVDVMVNEKLRNLRMLPSGICDDETFLRRVCLDVVGLLPTHEEHDKFLADTDPKKRGKKIDELLARPEFVDIWTMKFAELLQIRTQANGQQVSY